MTVIQSHATALARSIVTFFAALVPVVCSAQEAAEATETATSTGLQEVIVTAERFASTVQTTPVAIAAINAEALAERQVANVLTAAAEIPGVLITPTQGSNTNARISMRGAVQNTGGINFDPSVGIYIDGVYQPRIVGAFFDFF